MPRLLHPFIFALLTVGLALPSRAQETTVPASSFPNIIKAPLLKFHPQYVHSQIQTQLMRNGFNSLVQDVLPALARQQHLDDIRIPQIMIKSDKLIAKKKPFKGNVCYNWRFYLRNFRAHIDPGPRSISGRFGSNGEVQTDWNLSDNDFWMAGTFHFDADPVDKCALSPGPLGMLTPIPHKLPRLNLSVHVTIRGLESNGEFDFTIEKRPGTSAVQVGTIVRNSLTPRRVIFERNRLVKAVDAGISIASLFGLNSCNDVESCAKYLYRKYLREDPRIVNPLLKAVNAALNVPLVRSGNIDHKGFKLGYAVALQGLSTVSATSGNRLNADWNAKLTMFNKVHTCAKDVSYKPVGAPTSITWSNSDLNIAVPYDALGNVVYASAIQGLLCRSFGSHYSSWYYRVGIVPHGEISLARKSASSLSLYLPLRITGLGAISSVPLLGQASAAGTVDVTLEATIGFRVSGTRIVFSLNHLRADSLAGKLTLTAPGQKLPIHLPANQLQPLLQRIMDYVTNGLPTYSVPVRLPVHSGIGFSAALSGVYLSQKYLLAKMDFDVSP